MKILQAFFLTSLFFGINVFATSSLHAQTPAPQQIPGLAAWWNAGAPTTLTNSTSATVGTGAITDGTTVAQWFDASGNGYTLTQATTANQPTYHTGGHLGGQPYMTFNTSATVTNGSGAYMAAATALSSTLSNSGTGSYTFLFLVYKANGAEASYQVLASDTSGGNDKFFFLRLTSKFTRNASAAGVTMSEAAGHGIAYTFTESAANTGTESIYFDSAASAASTATGSVPAWTGAALNVGSNPGGSNTMNGEFYQILAYNRALSNSEIAQIYAYWNGLYGTSYNTSAGPLTAGSLSSSAVTQTSQTLTTTPITGGTSPYAYQWYRSTTSGNLGATLSGATATTLSDTGLTAQTSYYYTLKTTDSAASVIASAQLYAPTHGSTVKRVGVLGDSISILDPGSGNPPAVFANQLFAANRSLDVQVNNLAQSGETLRSLSRVNGGNSGITNKISSWNSAGFVPDIIEWMEGTNDAAQQAAGTTGYSNSQFALDIADVTSALHTAYPSATMVVNDIMGRNGAAAVQSAVQANNASWQSLIASNTSFMRAGSVSDYTYFTNNLSLLQDGLHPSVAGVTALANLWYGGSKSLFGIYNTVRPTFTTGRSSLRNTRAR